MRPWLSHRRGPASAAPSAAGSPPSGPAGAASARPGARSRRRSCPGRRGRARARAAGGAVRRVHSVAPASTIPSHRPRWTRPTPPPGPAAWTSWTGCSAAAWCPARSCCWPASPGWASRRCCSRRARWSRARRPVLYVTGEESAAQVRLRADRIGAVSDQLFLAAETDLDGCSGTSTQVQPRLLIVDSVQTIAAAGSRAAPGGVTQVREVDRGADRGGQGAVDDHRAGRARDQGRLDRRARGRWSTSSTWCCTSRATGIRSCGWSGRSRTGTARPTRSAASTWASTG